MEEKAENQKEKLQKRLRQIEARLQQINARESTASRKQRTRALILLGSHCASRRELVLEAAQLMQERAVREPLRARKLCGDAEIVLTLVDQAESAGTAQP